MLKRIFKTFFIFSICSAITIPTNAAVSVSDNSAFITKSEAMAVSQSLTERIILLENTMDDKIDNLIIAYLERNGVWHPNEQVVENASQNVATTVPKGEIGEDNLADKRFVQNTSKSGILTAEIRYKGANFGSYNLCRIGYAGVMTSTSIPYSDCGFELTCDFYEDSSANRLTNTNHTNGQLKYSILIGTAYGQRKASNNTTQFITCINLPTNDIVRPVTFFVQKDTSLWWNIRSRYRLPNSGSYARISNGAEGASLDIRLTNVVVN